ncbi:MAG TPA: uracil-DNA glycosylase [Clostridia bacterium]|nr:uracil-DNA glycosylase [Clostridia bacterium]
MHGVNEKVNCITCIHYYVTWDPDFPRGCRLYEFKTRRLPSQLVLESTGECCKNYGEKKKRNANA